MFVVWKFPITQTHMAIDIDPQARVIAVDFDPQGQICFWAIVDPHAQKVVQRYRVFGTGEPGIGIEHKHLGSWVQGPLVLHLFRED